VRLVQHTTDLRGSEAEDCDEHRVSAGAWASSSVFARGPRMYHI